VIDNFRTDDNVGESQKNEKVIKN